MGKIHGNVVERQKFMEMGKIYFTMSLSRNDPTLSDIYNVMYIMPFKDLRSEYTTTFYCISVAQSFWQCPAGRWRRRQNTLSSTAQQNTSKEANSNIIIHTSKSDFSLENFTQWPKSQEHAAITHHYYSNVHSPITITHLTPSFSNRSLQPSQAGLPLDVSPSAATAVGVVTVGVVVLLLFRK